MFANIVENKTKAGSQIDGLPAFYSQVPFQMHFKVPKNAIHIGLTGFAESTVMRYLFCIEGASSPGDAYALSMATTLVLLGLAILPESGVPADANAWKDLI